MKQVEAGKGGSAGERVAGKGMAVEKCLQLAVFTEKGIVDLLGGHGCCQRQIAAGDPLGERHDVRGHPFMVAGEHPPGAAETDGNLIGNQQNIKTVAEFPDPA